MMLQTIRISVAPLVSPGITICTLLAPRDADTGYKSDLSRPAATVTGASQSNHPRSVLKNLLGVFHSLETRHDNPNSPAEP